MTPKELAEIIRNILDNKKGMDIQVIDLEGKTILADYFVIVTGTSTPHIRALSEEVEFRLKEDHGIPSEHTEGRESGRWILLDYGSVIVHVFHEQERAFYSLEKLWEGRYGKVRE
jgi:ribosome-associated protein